MLVSCFPVSVGLYLDSGLFSVARGQVGLLSIRSEWPPGSKLSVSASPGAVVTSSGAGGGGIPQHDANGLSLRVTCGKKE